MIILAGTSDLVGNLQALFSLIPYFILMLGLPVVSIYLGSVVWLFKLKHQMFILSSINRQ